METKKVLPVLFFSDVFSHGRIWDHHSRHSVSCRKGWWQSY